MPPLASRSGRVCLDQRGAPPLAPSGEARRVLTPRSLRSAARAARAEIPSRVELLAHGHRDRIRAEEGQDVPAERILHGRPVADLAHADADGQLEALAAEAGDEAGRGRRAIQKAVLLRPRLARGLEQEALHP